jgi:hypothetical protein
VLIVVLAVDRLNSPPRRLSTKQPCRFRGLQWFCGPNPFTIGA